MLLLLLLLLYRNTETGKQKRKNGDRMTGERGRGRRRREITRDLGQHTARPACQSFLSYSRTYSRILSFLSYSNARFLSSCRTAVFLPPFYAAPPPPLAVIGVPNRTSRSAAVVLKQGAAMLSNPGTGRARGFWQADFCAGDASRITICAIVFEFGGRGYVVGYVKVAASAHVHAVSFSLSAEKLKQTLFQVSNRRQFLFSPLTIGVFQVSHFSSINPSLSATYIPEECVIQYVASICVL